MKFGANQLRFEDLHYSLSDGYVATRLLFRLICNCRASESRSKLYLVMPSPTSGIYQQDYCSDGYVATKLMCRLICNLPEFNIRIFNPLASYFLLIGMSFGSQILILYAVEFFAALNNTCISARTLALLLLYNSYIRCCPYKRHIPTRLMCRRICTCC